MCLGVVLPGAALAAQCPAQPTTQAFAQFGDYNAYSLVPGGDFENLTWGKIGRPDLGPLESDPFHLAAGSRGVKMKRNEGVTSAPLCVDATMPHLRFVSGSQTWTETLGSQPEWAPTRYIGLRPGAIHTDGSGMLTITLRSQGDWSVDNVFIDPYRR